MSVVMRDRLGGAAAIILAITACGGGPGHPASSAPTLSDSVETIASVFAPCSEELDAVADAWDAVASTAGWLRIVEVVSGGWDGVSEPTYTFATVAFDTATGSAGSLPTVGADQVEVEVFDTFLPGVEWSLGYDAEVWLALVDSEGVDAPNVVGAVVVILPDGRVFFPGDCHHDIFYEPLDETFRDIDAAMAGLVGLVGEDLLGGLTAASQDGDLGLREDDAEPITVLNPESVDSGYLESLRFALLHIGITDELGQDFTICTRVEAGWNDCIVPDATAAARGYAVDAHLDEGPLEVWLLDSAADLSRPSALLGIIDELGTGDVALRLEIDTEGIDESWLTAEAIEDAARTTVLERVPLDELDYSDPNWPAL